MSVSLMTLFFCILSLDGLAIQMKTERDNEEYNIILLHEKFSGRSIDKYIINLAIACIQLGYKVTILTSKFEKKDHNDKSEVSGSLPIEYSGKWIPQSFFGYFKETFSALKAAWMAAFLSFYASDTNPKLVITDVSIWAIYILKYFSNYKLFYVENFRTLRNSEDCHELSKLNLSLITAKGMKLVDEIIVENSKLAETLKLSFPMLNKKPKILYPAVDLGQWLEPALNIKKILPDLLEENVIFLTMGKYRSSSNFALAIKSFEIFLTLIDDKDLAKKFQLVIAGYCKTIDEKVHYKKLINSVKKKYFASQITFLIQLPTLHEKTLMVISEIIILPAKNDLSSNFILKAMCEGKPILATSSGVAPKMLINNVSGLIVDPEPKHFAIALKKLIDKPGLGKFFGQTAMKAFEESYSFDRLCQRLNSTIKNIPLPPRSLHGCK